jgi:predicted metal-dependent enzyme (double-stranded beta helix superfamily)
MAKLAAFEDFVAAMRKLYREPLTDAARFERARPLLAALLADPALRERARGWHAPNDPARGVYRNLLFYEDPDYGFVVNALVKAPGDATPIHDHGPIWTLYGVLDGGERVVRYRRTDDGRDPARATLAVDGDHDVVPGYIDFVPPHDIHAEFNGDRRTVGVILRSGNVGRTEQCWYDDRTGRITRRFGPEQVPHPLD